MTVEFFQSPAIEFQRTPFIFPRIILKIIFSKFCHIVPPFTKWRNFNLDGIDPVKKIFPEKVVIDHFIKILVRCCDKPDIDFYRLIAAQLRDPALFNGT